MIAFGDEGSSVIAGSVRLAPGLGLTNRFVIDQHFRQRDRLGRLITALAYNPFAIGIGLDEDTAVFIGPTKCWRWRAAAASRSSTPRTSAFPRSDSASEGQPVCVLGLKVHVLVAGTTFDLNTRTASAAKLVPE